MSVFRVEFIDPISGETEEFCGTSQEIALEIEIRSLTFGSIGYRVIESIALLGVLSDVTVEK